jgi:hypothetical protein
MLSDRFDPPPDRGRSGLETIVVNDVIYDVFTIDCNDWLQVERVSGR